MDNKTCLIWTCSVHIFSLYGLTVVKLLNVRVNCIIFLVVNRKRQILNSTNLIVHYTILFGIVVVTIFYEYFKEYR